MWPNRERGTGLAHIEGLHGVLAPANADGHCFSASLRDVPESVVKGKFRRTSGGRLVVHFV